MPAPTDATVRDKLQEIYDASDQLIGRLQELQRISGTDAGFMIELVRSIITQCAKLTPHNGNGQPP